MIGLEQSRGGRTKRPVSLQTLCLPVVSHGTALQRPGLWRHSTCFARQVSLTENERPKYAKLRFNVCSPDKKFSFSFRHNKQLIAQLVGRHEDLFNPENPCLPRATWLFWVEQIFMSPSKLGNNCIISHSLRGDIVDCHPEETLSTEAPPCLYGSASVDNVSSGWQSTMSPRKECYIYFIIPNVPFLQQIPSPLDIAVWHSKLSPG